VCHRSTTTCATCRHFRKAVTLRLGYCALDHAHRPLTGDEQRACWERQTRETEAEARADAEAKAEAGKMAVAVAPPAAVFGLWGPAGSAPAERGGSPSSDWTKS
jgi:hypothetical protein